MSGYLTGRKSPVHAAMLLKVRDRQRQRGSENGRRPQGLAHMLRKAIRVVTVELVPLLSARPDVIKTEDAGAFRSEIGVASFSRGTPVAGCTVATTGTWLETLHARADSGVTMTRHSVASHLIPGTRSRRVRVVLLVLSLSARQPVKRTDDAGVSLTEDPAADVGISRELVLRPRRPERTLCSRGIQHVIQTGVITT